MDDPALSRYLRDRRSRLDPAALGLPLKGRRAPGLRREEVALRANISPTWYTWLEQGRSGIPSADVLDRIAKGLMLSAPEREHLHVLAFGHPPQARYTEHDAVEPRLQHMLDAMPFSPAFIRTATWDVVAWNAAAAVVLDDFGQADREGRNLLRRFFCDASVRAKQDDWLLVASGIVKSFRISSARAGASREVAALVAELQRRSPEFDRLWSDNEVSQGERPAKRLHHPRLGTIDLEVCEFMVSTSPDLELVVYNPVSKIAARSIRAMVRRHGSKGKSLDPALTPSES